jgi:hypothetical protein
MIVVIVVALAGCAGMSETPQRTRTGGAAGAAGGAVIGAALAAVVYRGMRTPVALITPQEAEQALPSQQAERSA